MNKILTKISFIIFIIPMIVLVNNFIVANADETSENNVNAVHIIDPNDNKVITTIIPQPYHLELDLPYYKSQVELIVKKIAKGSATKSGYSQKMILDRIDPTTGNIIKGRPKMILDEKVLVGKIMELSFTGGKVNLPIKLTKSGYDEKEAASLSEVVLASYTTRFNPNRIGRSKNIELSASSINNVIVGSGDIFSFNDTVGPRDIAAGYQEAPEFLQGKIVVGIGGGICQTSSTLFNAIDQLEVKILERHRHTRDIGYVPKGRDATVSFGGLDFSFQNTLGIPVLIKAYYSMYGSITVQIRTSKENEYMLRNLED
ncbi:VanW family protein [Ureibacillus sp. MALMAid1270]|uniref:VanW family protein n=1 Tax=Ureibacillus sp. MALMAid1270 TaxID=3411629 RepID=UPI003BA57D00